MFYLDSLQCLSSTFFKASMQQHITIFYLMDLLQQQMQTETTIAVMTQPITIA